MILLFLCTSSVVLSCNFIYLEEENSTCTGIVCPRGPFELDTCSYNSTLEDTSWGYFCNGTGTDSGDSGEDRNYIAEKRVFYESGCEGDYEVIEEILCNGMEDDCYCNSESSKACLTSLITVNKTNNGEDKEINPCLNETVESVLYVTNLCLDGLGITCEFGSGPRFDEFADDDPDCGNPDPAVRVDTNKIEMMNNVCVEATCPVYSKNLVGAWGIVAYLALMALVMLASQS